MDCDGQVLSGFKTGFHRASNLWPVAKASNYREIVKRNGRVRFNSGRAMHRLSPEPMRRSIERPGLEVTLVTFTYFH